MAISKIIEELRLSSTRPNKFTVGMGELIRKAREESGLSQRALSEQIYLRQASISDFENGKTEPDAETLLLLSHHLNKPIGYFFPKQYIPDGDLEESNITDIEKELLILIRKLTKEDLVRIIAQVKAIVNLAITSQHK